MKPLSASPPGVLLAPWPALVLGTAWMGLAQWWQTQAPLLALAQQFASDALMLLRAVPLWCLLSWPVLWLPRRGQVLALGLLGSLLLLTQAGLALYLSVAGVPLGADLLAYTWQELQTTVSAAQVTPPASLLAAVLCSLVVLWWRLLQRLPATPSSRQTLAALGLCLIASVALPVQWPSSGPRASPQVNPLMHFVRDVLNHQPRLLDTTTSDAYPFEHAETTPDTLGPLLDLDPQTPPNLVFLIVEGLGRSFSGPNARLGSFTPFLDELASQSLYWENFLAPQGRTFAVLPSVLGSLPFGPYGTRDMAYDTLPGLLKRQGYSLRYLSGSNLAFDHQGDFLAQSGVQDFWSAKDFSATDHKLSEWGYPDGDLMDAVLNTPAPPSPSVTMVQTMSMHSPFKIPRMEQYRSLVQARLQTLNLPSDVRQARLQHQDIYASIMYTDDVLREFFAKARQKPQWRNTVFVITGDHRLPEIPMDTHIERYHVPLIVYSPLLRQPLSIKSVSSHFDIAPALLAMLSNRYRMPMPERVHWMGTGLDVHPGWRNVHTLALKQTKTDLHDYIAGEYFLSRGQLMSLQDGLVSSTEDKPEILQSLQTDLTRLQTQLAQLERSDRLIATGHEQMTPYSPELRTLTPAHKALQIEGVVVSQTQGEFDASGRLNVQGVFSLQGAQPSPVFVPLLVLSDANGKELAETSGQAITLQTGESRQVMLSIAPQTWSTGPYYLSLIVSHPDTGRPIGKGQYHVEIRR